MISGVLGVPATIGARLGLAGFSSSFSATSDDREQRVSGWSTAFEILAIQFDVRAMTPKRIDALAAKLPVERPDDLEIKMTLLTRGAEWLSHLAAFAEEASGLDQRDELTRRLEAEVDLLQQLETARFFAQRRGQTTTALDMTVAFLRRMADWRDYPEAGLPI